MEPPSSIEILPFFSYSLRLWPSLAQIQPSFVACVCVVYMCIIILLWRLYNTTRKEIKNKEFQGNNGSLTSNNLESGRELISLSMNSRQKKRAGTLNK